MMGEEVTRQRATVTTDGYDDNVLSWDTPDELVIENVAVAPGSPFEAFQGRDAVAISTTLYVVGQAPDVKAADRMVVRGQVFDVVGDPEAWINPFDGTPAGMAVFCKRVTG